MVIYTCPKCGADCVQETLLTYPPIYVTRCTKCDWKDSKKEKIIRVPYDENPIDKKDLNDIAISKIPETYPPEGPYSG